MPLDPRQRSQFIAELSQGQPEDRNSGKMSLDLSGIEMPAPVDLTKELADIARAMAGVAALKMPDAPDMPDHSRALNGITEAVLALVAKEDKEPETVDYRAALKAISDAVDRDYSAALASIATGLSRLTGAIEAQTELMRLPKVLVKDRNGKMSVVVDD